MTSPTTPEIMASLDAALHLRLDRQLARWDDDGGQPEPFVWYRFVEVESAIVGWSTAVLKPHPQAARR